MHSTPVLSRRTFLAATSALAATTLLDGAEPAAKRRWPVICFAKPFQKLPYHEIAEIAAEVGWDGIECTLRKGGTIEPAAVEDELPKLVEALRKAKIDLPIVATDVDDANDPLAQKVLKTAARLGVRQYRLKHFQYDLNKPLRPQVDAFTRKIHELARLNSELQVQGTIQNHSGKTYLGAPVWDIAEMIRGLDPKHMAVYFDIGHATVEGGYSWPLQARIVEGAVAVVSVKDFLWHKTDGPKNQWRAEWCPLGEGMIQKDFFDYLKKTKFNGPICQHFEYEVGSGQRMIAAMKKDFAWIQQRL